MPQFIFFSNCFKKYKRTELGIEIENIGFSTTDQQKKKLLASVLLL